MSSNRVTLYDIPSKQTDPHTCWSPNVWKTRLVLNYKNVPYITEFLGRNNIDSTLSTLGIPSNPPKPAGKSGPPQSPYTVPAVQLADGSTAMDSAIIAPILEEKYPEPSLHLENNLHQEASALQGQLALHLLGVLFPRILRDVMVPEVAPHFRAKREAAVGYTMEEFEAAKGGDGAWKAARPGFVAMEKFLKENKKDEGPFILGSQVCYGDFVIAAMAEGMKRIGHDLYDRFTSSCEGIEELHVACALWLEHDS